MPDPGLDKLLRTAINEQRLVRLHYRGKIRIIEPHDYGIHKGITRLLSWQRGGESSSPLPNWRWLDTDLISDAELLNETFSGGRPNPSGRRHQWDQLFLRVKPAHPDS